MSKISEAVGSRFERIICENFIELSHISDSEHEKPDFEHSDFCLEAKTSNWNFSAQIKGKQLEKFKNIDKRVSYVFGFHNMDGVQKKLSRFKSAKSKVLIKKMDEEMSVNTFYFLNLEIVENIFNKHTQNRSNTEEITGYFQERMFHQIFENSSIKRKEKQYNARDYYNVNSATLVQERGIIFKDRQISYILDSNQDRQILDYIDSLTIPF